MARRSMFAHGLIRGGSAALAVSVAAAMAAVGPSAANAAGVAPAGSPAIQSGTHVVQSGTPVAQSGTPVAQAGTPVAQSGPAGGKAGAPVRRKVTLVTGDVVSLQTSADGRQVATAVPGPGRAHITFSTQQQGDDVYVIPSDAIPLLAADVLDRELFDITQLVAQGYDDSRVGSTPLIVEYAKASATAKAPATLPGTTSRFTLESIDARAVRAAKRQADSLWSTLLAAAPDGRARTTAQRAAADSVQKVWLDNLVKVDDAQSNEQIGAPAAWAAGYDGTGVKVAVLDTGIDAAHPDFANKVVAAQDFTADGTTTDLFGHGTHVASIVAGSGAASGGTYKGVAPGASLVNAKVLDQFGSGTEAQIIEGMEWAAAQGAKVANMSLGTHSPSSGDDPLVQAVDEISESTGILFAIAADNIGPADSTITSPGWADEALTVGAVDKDDVLASFSSRGPRLGDYGIKPDLTAPGVDIIAARADGTALGPIVDERYVQLSGTSMAAPHAAAAAAILSQQHPTWTNRQLKNALISSAETSPDYSVYQQGGGRLDVARAVSQQVVADPGTLNLGFLPWPHTDEEPVSKTVTYANDGDADVTLDLALDVSGKETGAAPSGMFTLSASTVTVPAGGTAAVTVTADPNAGEPDLYGGYLTGTAGDTVVHTSVGLYKEPEMYNVAVPAIARDGRQADGISQAELWGPAIGGFQTQYYRGGVTPVFRVPPGTYSLMGYIFTMDEPNSYALEATVVGKPQLVVDADTTVNLDARGAEEIVAETAKPRAPSTVQLGYYRALDELSFSSSFTLSSPIDRMFAVPSTAVDQGEFEFYSRWTLTAPPIEMSVKKPRAIGLQPYFMSNSPKVDGKHTLPLVYVGSGRPQDFAGRDVRGKIALIQRTTGMTFNSQINNAEDAGAAVALIYNNRAGLLLGYGGDAGTVPIPAFSIDQDPGQMLVDLLQQGQVRLSYSGTSVSPYAYELMLPNPDRIADSQTYVIDNTNTARVDSDYYAHVNGQVGTDVMHGLRPWTSFAFGFARELPRPLQRTEWVSTGDTTWWHLAWSNYPFDGEFDGLVTQYAAGERRSESTFLQPVRPGIPEGPTGWEDLGAPPYREGDELVIAEFPYSDNSHYGWGSTGDVASTKLYRGSQLLAESAYPVETYAVPLAGSATYRLESVLKRPAPWWRYSTEVDTAWTFTSQRPESGREFLPMLQVDYDLDLDLWNRAPDQSAYDFRFRPRYAPGAGEAEVDSVKAWASFNDGGTWKRIGLHDLGNGGFEATLQHPAAAKTSGAVSLRIQATDAEGNAVDQTIMRAYGLAP